MHLYFWIVVAMCLEKVSSADLQHPFAACHPLHIAPAMAVFYAALIYTAAVLETVLPTIEAMLPDKAPLLVGACTGCNALALRVSYGRSASFLGKQVSA